MTDYVTDWRVTKATTDKLAGALMEEDSRGYEVYKIEFTGGRDWVIVGYRERSATPPPMPSNREP